MSGILQGLIGSLKSAASSAADAYFNLTTLLLNTSSTNGAQNNTFLDSSTNNFTITRNGNTTQGTFTPFSQTGWSNYFDGNGDQLAVGNVAAAQVGSSDFSIECFVYAAKQTNTYAQGLVSYGIAGDTNGTSYLSFQIGPTGYLTVFYAQTATATLTDPSLFPLNQWVHAAVCRSGSTISLYLNGTRVATASTSATVGSSGTALTIGGQWFSNDAGRQLQGYISNVRIVKGSSAYSASSSTITIPTSVLTSITDTSLLTCQSNRFIDNSSNGYSITPAGETSVQAFSPFAPTAAYDAAVVGGSGYFDGTGDYLTVPDTTSLEPATGDFCFETWVYHTSASNGSTFDSYVHQPSGGLFVYRNLSNKIQVDSDGVVAILTSASNVPFNSWAHIAVTRSGTTLRIFINGVVDASVTNSTNIAGTGVISYGGRSDGSILDGYLSSTRFVKGSAVYTATFTPPTAPLTAITNTQILLSYTNSGIYDSTAKNVLETVGNAQVSTTQAKWGTTSMYFDGTGDTLILPNNPIYDFGTSDFTIEGWVYVIALSGSAQETFIGRGVNAGASFHIALTTGGAWVYYLSSNNSTWNIASAVNIGTNSLNTWQHIALVRNGTTFTPYLNGVAGTTTTSSSAIYWNSGTSNVNQITVGGTEASTQVLNGYIDDLRITKGYARYTANFTPPTAAFGTQ